ARGGAAVARGEVKGERERGGRDKGPPASPPPFRGPQGEYKETPAAKQRVASKTGLWAMAHPDKIRERTRQSGIGIDGNPSLRAMDPPPGGAPVGDVSAEGSPRGVEKGKQARLDMRAWRQNTTKPASPPRERDGRERRREWEERARPGSALGSESSDGAGYMGGLGDGAQRGMYMGSESSYKGGGTGGSSVGASVPENGADFSEKQEQWLESCIEMISGLVGTTAPDASRGDEMAPTPTSSGGAYQAYPHDEPPSPPHHLDSHHRDSRPPPSPPHHLHDPRDPHPHRDPPQHHPPQHHQHQDHGQHHHHHQDQQDQQDQQQQQQEQQQHRHRAAHDPPHRANRGAGSLATPLVGLGVGHGVGLGVSGVGMGRALVGKEGLADRDLYSPREAGLTDLALDTSAHWDVSPG
ncbi:hypothetical protein T484DRAFT_1763780, partial [Baffinella frigidus]